MADLTRDEIEAARRIIKQMNEASQGSTLYGHIPDRLCDMALKSLFVTEARDFDQVLAGIVGRMGGHTISFSEAATWRTFMGLLKQVKESECFIASPLERK